MQIYVIHSSHFSTLSEFYAYVNSEFFHADYFGNNLDALADCLSDLESGVFIWQGSAKSKKELRNFDTIYVIIWENHRLELR